MDPQTQLHRNARAQTQDPRIRVFQSHIVGQSCDVQFRIELSGFSGDPVDEIKMQIGMMPGAFELREELPAVFTFAPVGVVAFLNRIIEGFSLHFLHETEADAFQRRRRESLSFQNFEGFPCKIPRHIRVRGADLGWRRIVRGVKRPGIAGRHRIITLREIFRTLFDEDFFIAFRRSPVTPDQTVRHVIDLTEQGVHSPAQLKQSLVAERIPLSVPEDKTGVAECVRLRFVTPFQSPYGESFPLRAGDSEIAEGVEADAAEDFQKIVNRVQRGVVVVDLPRRFIMVGHAGKSLVIPIIHFSTVLRVVTRQTDPFRRYRNQIFFPLELPFFRIADPDRQHFSAAFRGNRKFRSRNQPDDMNQLECRHLSGAGRFFPQDDFGLRNSVPDQNDILSEGGQRQQQNKETDVFHDFFSPGCYL